MGWFILGFTVVVAVIVVTIALAVDHYWDK